MYLPQRTSPRATRHDYTSSGFYFVTICCKHMQHHFGKIVDGKMELNRAGKICEQEIQRMVGLRKNTEVHEYVVMPNHVHLLVCIVGTGLSLSENSKKNSMQKETINISKNHITSTDNNNVVPTHDGIKKFTNQSLGSIIGCLKSAISKECNKAGLGFARQWRYHDHIITHQKEYENIKRYIINNPANRGEKERYKY